nr:MAG TPA_asm: holin protein [Caudoviricetes sp.]
MADRKLYAMDLFFSPRICKGGDRMEAWTNVGVPLIVALLTSTALWGVVSKVILKRMELTAKRSKADEAERKMLVGLAHDRIIHLGMVYIERGYVTQDEYENLQVYLYEPYEEMGGNGSARRVMEEVRKLPIR